jgi:hypothetical protein
MPLVVVYRGGNGQGYTSPPSLQYPMNHRISPSNMSFECDVSDVVSFLPWMERLTSSITAKDPEGNLHIATPGNYFHLDLLRYHSILRPQIAP